MLEDGSGPVRGVRALRRGTTTTALVWALAAAGAAHAQTDASAPITGSATANQAAPAANTMPSQAATAQAPLAQSVDRPEAVRDGGLEDIVVTAQRRSERLQDVPIAVSAFSAEALQTRNVTNISGITGFAPNVKLFTQGYATSISVAIRGSVVTNNAPYFEPVVGLYVDGVYVGKARGGNFDSVDIERIEVLRGPQGTLYGRNTLAGAINIITAKPTGEFGGNVKAGIGNYGRYFGQANINFPKLDTPLGTFKVKAGLRREKRAGTRNISNPYPQATTAKASKQAHLDQIDSWSGQIAVRWEPASNLTFDYSFDRSRQHNSQVYAQLTNLDAGGVFDPTAPRYNGIPLYLYLRPNGRVVTSINNGSDLPGLAGPQLEHANVFGHALTSTLNVGSTTIKSITSFRRVHYREVKDFDGSPLQVITTLVAFQPKSFSQELQATGAVINDLKYTIGAFYYYDRGQIKSFQSFFGSLTDVQYGYGTDAYAGYGQVEYNPATILGGKLTVTAGLRYNRETKRINRMTRNALTNVVTVPYITGRRAFDGWQPTAIAKYDVTRGFNVYAKYAKGFKSGGFNAEAANAAETLTPFNPESVDSFEIGSKAQLFDNRLQLNVAGFHDNHTDLQLSIFDPRATTASSVVRNAGKATISGFEVEAQAAPASWLRLQGTFGYLHTKYKVFLNGGVNVANDRAFPYSPKITASASADALLARFGPAELRFIADYSHSDRYFINAFSLTRTNLANAYRTLIGAQNTVDLRLRLNGVAAGSGTLEVSIAARNVFNDDYRIGAVDFGAGTFGGLTTSFYGRPRQLSADVAYRF